MKKIVKALLMLSAAALMASCSCAGSGYSSSTPTQSSQDTSAPASSSVDDGDEDPDGDPDEDPDGDAGDEQVGYDYGLKVGEGETAEVKPLSLNTGATDKVEYMLTGVQLTAGTKIEIVVGDATSAILPVRGDCPIQLENGAIKEAGEYSFYYCESNTANPQEVGLWIEKKLDLVIDDEDHRSPFYLVGSMNNWTVHVHGYGFTEDGSVGEKKRYSLEVELPAGAQFKVRKSNQTGNEGYFPALGDNYKVTEAKTYKIYFIEEGDESYGEGDRAYIHIEGEEQPPVSSSVSIQLGRAGQWSGQNMVANDGKTEYSIADLELKEGDEFKIKFADNDWRGYDQLKLGTFAAANFEESAAYIHDGETEAKSDGNIKVKADMTVTIYAKVEAETSGDYVGKSIWIEGVLDGTPEFDASKLAGKAGDADLVFVAADKGPNMIAQVKVEGLDVTKDEVFTFTYDGAPIQPTAKWPDSNNMVQNETTKALSVHNDAEDVTLWFKVESYDGTKFIYDVWLGGLDDSDPTPTPVSNAHTMALGRNSEWSNVALDANGETGYKKLQYTLKAGDEFKFKMSENDDDWRGYSQLKLSEYAQAHFEQSAAYIHGEETEARSDDNIKVKAGDDIIVNIYVGSEADKDGDYTGKSIWIEAYSSTPTPTPDPSETVKFTVIVPDAWEAAYAYAWKGSDKNAEWPGVAMTLKSGHTYEIELAKGYEKIIFNNGSGKQTENLDLDYDNPTFDVSTPVSTAHTMALGRNSEWSNVALDVNGETGYKVLQYTLKAGDEFKFKMSENDDDWRGYSQLKLSEYAQAHFEQSAAYVHDGETEARSDDNIKVKAGEDIIVNIYVGSEADKDGDYTGKSIWIEAYSSTPTPTPDPTDNHVDWYVVGTGSYTTADWTQAGGVQMVKSSNPYYIGEIKNLSLEAGDVLKIAPKSTGDWYGYNALGNDDCKALFNDLGEPDHNMEVKADGIYNIYFTTNHLIYVSLAAA